MKTTKASITKLAGAPQTRAFPQTLHRVRVRAKEPVLVPKSQKRENTFSQSRDTREDRGSRQMKMSHSPQTFSHGR